MFICLFLINTFYFIHAAIFGGDQRQDISALNQAWQQKAAAIAVAVPTHFLIAKTDGHFEHEDWQSSHYGEAIGLCPGERFSEQTSFGHCTAFLISPTHLLTAGHCLLPAGEIRDQAHPYCDGFSFWLGYNDLGVEPSGSHIKAEDVLRCLRVVYAVNNQKMLPDQAPLDFAILELTHPVTHVEPLTLSRKVPAPGAALATIGHPHGLPAKFSGWDLRRSDKGESTTVSAFLDSVAGNSGGPVFDRQGEVIGVLISGHQHDTFKEGSCQRINRCAANGRPCKQNSSLPHQNLIQQIQVIEEFLLPPTPSNSLPSV